MQPIITADYLASQGLSEDFEKRFWSKVNKNGPIPNHCPELGPCWIWTAAINGGYGAIKRGRAIASTNIRATRASLILNFVPVKPTDYVLHKCDNPPCVNPDHLFLGDTLANMRDAASKNRVPFGENHYACKLSESDLARMWDLHKTMNNQQIAEMFGVRNQTVSAILNGLQRKRRITSTI